MLAWDPWDVPIKVADLPGLLLTGRLTVLDQWPPGSTRVPGKLPPEPRYAWERASRAGDPRQPPVMRPARPRVYRPYYYY